jgi:hypothetical protein
MALGGFDITEKPERSELGELTDRFTRITPLITPLIHGRIVPSRDRDAMGELARMAGAAAA